VGIGETKNMPTATMQVVRGDNLMMNIQ